MEAQIASLGARLDALAREITNMPTAEERVAVQPVSKPEPPPTEQAFRDLHERAILAIIADDRARLLSEAKRKPVVDLVAAFWRDHQLPEDGRDQVVSILMEQGRRASEIFERFQTTSPAADDPRRPEWAATWNEFQVGAIRRSCRRSMHQRPKRSASICWPCGSPSSSSLA